MPHHFRRTLWTLLCCAAAALPAAARAEGPTVYRPPAVPLVACNPMFSIWSNADRLTDDVTRHWTKRDHRLTGMVRVDGQALRVMGDEPREVPAMPQVGNAVVLPTRTIYQFEGSNVHLTLTFFQPALPTDIDVLSRPLTYVVWNVRSTDGKPHAVSVYLSASGELAVDHPQQKVTWEKAAVPGFVALRAGTTDQRYVKRNGDDSRADWGYVYVAAEQTGAQGLMAPQVVCFNTFRGNGPMPGDESATPRAVGGDLTHRADWDQEVPTLALTVDLGQVGTEPVERRTMVAYDQVWDVDFFGRRSRGYWRRDPAMNGEKLIARADQQYADLNARCVQFDAELMADITKVGGADYAYMCSLAYRQTIAGCGLAADANGQPMFFTKENTSNGNMGTVDVLFPMDPVWLFLSPTLAKATVAPVMVYAASPQWKIPYAPHDLGEFPRAFSKSRQDGTEDASEPMPVEESGNLIILADAIARADGNTRFIDPWWGMITRWVDYLEKFGPDPETQLCTDDFNGKLAHNSNLGVKAIVGLGAYADLCKMRGDTAGYDKYIKLARDDAKNWMKQAGDGAHYRLAYNKPGTWSQLYNLVFDQILRLEVFPAEVYRNEVAHYKTVLKPYGLPLDNRNMRTKSDWTIWTASLAENQADFETLIAPMLNYLQETPDRVAFSDGYFVDRLERRTNFFHARPVIGGVFARMLTDGAMWKKWSSMDKQVVGTYAPLPQPPLVEPVVPTSEATPLAWRYTTDQPGPDFAEPDFDDKGWKTGEAGFGHGGTGAKPRTDWDTADIWLRRSAEVPPGQHPNLYLRSWHDEDVEFYINGVLAASADGYTTAYQQIELTPAGLAALKPGGRNTFAVHCHQTTGGQYVDVGLVTVTER